MGIVLSEICGLLQRWKQALLLIALVGLLWIAPPAIAQPPTESSPAPAESAPANRSVLGAEDISSEKVSQFVNAYVRVLALVDQREGDLQGAETEVESARVQQEIEKAAFGAIADAGLTWQEYLQLLGLANSDPEFGERVATQLLEEID